MVFLIAMYAPPIHSPAAAFTGCQTSPLSHAPVVPHAQAAPIQPPLRAPWLSRHTMNYGSILILMVYLSFPPQAWAQQQNAAKPLAGYTAVLIEPFTVENNQLTKDFPAGEEANLQITTLARLQASRLFVTVIDGSRGSFHPPQPPNPSATGEPATLILSVTIVGFNKGSSGARMLAWPFPVGASEAKARFAFRDAASGREVLRFEREARFRALASGGIASKDEQMSHVKGGLVDALLKEIERNR